jgi:hypothetical protein
VSDRVEAAVQAMLDRSSLAKQYYADDLSTYHALEY